MIRKKSCGKPSKRKSNVIKKNNNIGYLPFVLPSDEIQLRKFIKNNKILLMEKIVTSIEFALSKNLPIIDIFTFENTSFVITLLSVNFKENIDNIYKFYIDHEHYELCNRISGISKKLEIKHEIKTIPSRS